MKVFRNSSTTLTLAVVLALTTLGFSAAYAFAIATELPVFDRYVLPVLPLVGLLLIRRTREGLRVAVAGVGVPGVPAVMVDDVGGDRDVRQGRWLR